MKSPSILDYEPSEVSHRLIDSARAVWKATGKHPLIQAMEIWRLRRSQGRLSPREYYYFGLYDDARFGPADKERFVGFETQEWILRQTTDNRWRAVVDDKVAFHAFMQSHGFPVPRIIAVYHAFRSCPDAIALRSKDELKNFLRRAAEYPMFSKPVTGTRSLGVARLEGYDATGDELESADGRRFPVEDYVQSLERYSSTGYLFQAVEHPHQRIRDICGDRLATIRLMIVLDRNGPELNRAVWKIPAGKHIGDNFWRGGNLLAAVNRDTGEVTRVMTGVGHEVITVERHPDTNAPVLGVTLPDWKELKEVCLAAARTIPGVALQGWDVAPTARGPVLVEVNVGGHFNLPQLASGVGMLEDRFRNFLLAQGVRPKSAVDRLADLGKKMYFRIGGVSNHRR